MDLLRGPCQRSIQWTLKAHGAFADLREALYSLTVFQCPDFSRPFVVQTDASATGLGAVLAQEYPVGDHPVAYLGRKFQRAEQRYATIEREALALKWAVTAWRYYLTGAPFYLVTDHALLVWMD